MSKPGRFRARMALILRILGATGLFVALLGLIPLATGISLTSTTAWKSAWHEFRAGLAQGHFQDRVSALGMGMVVVGGTIFLAVLLVQILAGLRTFAMRRSAVAFNSLLQIALALGLLLGVNIYAFQHFTRQDCTGRRFAPSVVKIDNFPYARLKLFQPSDPFRKQFTLPESVANELGKLHSPTTIVVYQRHKTFGQLGDKPDAYDYAAERKVVEKVQDLVNQFREFGPQFRVEVIDVESEDHDQKLDQLTHDAPKLRQAINEAPDNSIFFHSRQELDRGPDRKPEIRESVQRLSFNEFYQLDKTASLGKAVIVVLERPSGDAAGAVKREAVEEKLKRLTDPDARTGPDYRVLAWTAGQDDLAKKLGSVADLPAETKARVENAEGSTVFVIKDGRVEALSWQAFLDLNDGAARDFLRPRGNLVLIPQGVEPFARKVLSIEERRPRVGIAVIHELLTTEGDYEPYTLAGVKKALSSHGFDVTDIVLKRWGGQEPEPVAYTAEESKLEGVEEQLAEVDASLQTLQALRRQRQMAVERFKSTSLAELGRIFRTQLNGRPFTEDLRKIQIDAISGELETLDFAIKQNTEARVALESDRQQLSSRERVVEERRMTDVKAKMTRLLRECDLLLIPRLTLRNLTSSPPDYIPARLHRMDDVQVAAVKEFLRAGKPVLACLGPNNEPPERRMPGPSGPDGLEDLLAELGIVLGKQTVLFLPEGRAFAERRSSLFAIGNRVDVPPVKLSAPAEKRATLSTPWALVGTSDHPMAPNPISQSLELVARNLGPRQKLDLALRHPRPVYFVPVRPEGARFTPEFLVSDDESWNEDQPFATRERTPRFEPPKPDDPSKGTREEKRRGPFPLAVAVETTVPASWVEPRAQARWLSALVLAGGSPGGPVALAGAALHPVEWFAPADFQPTPLRLAAIGHGGLFNGPELNPVKERLLLDSCNWLLQREERLPKAREAWSYPRVPMSERQRNLWFWGTLVALPGLFVYVGILVVITRRYR